ncbi:MAG: YncE family protein, partial [Planctomycetota bacterium]
VLSPDGNTLVCCNGSTDDVSVVDLTTWTETARISTPSYPVRAAFTPDGSRALVVARNSQTLVEITLAPAGGGAPQLTGMTQVGFQPFEIVIPPSGNEAFVAAYGNSSLDRVDLATLTTTLGAVVLPGMTGAQPLGLEMDRVGNRLVVATRDGSVHFIDAATLQIEESAELEANTADVVWNETQTALLLASPLERDGLHVIRPFDECGEAFCFGDGGVSPGCTACPCGNNAPAGTAAGCANASNAFGASLSSLGRPRVSDPTLRFEAQGLPSASFALLLSGPNALPNAGACPPGSGLAPPVLDGLRCVGGGTRRLGARQSDAAGTVGISGPGWESGAALLGGSAAGTTILFQATYRTNPAQGCGTGLNTTNAVRIRLHALACDLATLLRTMATPKTDKTWSRG